jgi:hypothetical protein
MRQKIKKNHIRKFRENKKALATSMIAVVLILVAVGIVGYITYNGIKNGGLMIKAFNEKYGPPKINDSTAYGYSIEDFQIINANDIGCTAVANRADMYNCPANKYLDFAVSIKNSGGKMRKINGAIVICKAECKGDSCSIPKGCSNDVTTRGQKPCYIDIGKTMECGAGSSKFSSGGYVVYSAAVCALESTYGCYSPTLREADKIYNPMKAFYIQVS